MPPHITTHFLTILSPRHGDHMPPSLHYAGDSRIGVNCQPHDVATLPASMTAYHKPPVSDTRLLFLPVGQARPTARTMQP